MKKFISCIGIIFMFVSGLEGQTTVMLNPSKDATIANNGNSDNAGTNFILGKPGASSGITEPIRGLIQFDVSSIPLNATITEVTFSFLRKDPGGATGEEIDLEIYRVTNSWQEGTSAATSQFPSLATSTSVDVTWTNRGGSNGAWTTSGGDFDGTLSTSFTSAAISSDVVIEIPSSANLVADVQSWADGTFDNHGWIFITPSAGTQELLWLASREDTGNSPILEVTYTTPITWTGTTSTNWNTAANWNGGEVPIASDDVVIPDVTNDPVISAGVVAELNDLIINSGADLLVESGGSLAIYGEATVDGNFFVERNMTGSGGYSIGGVPVSNAEIQDFDAQIIYGYTNPSGFSSNINMSSDAAAPGVGFFVGYNATNPSITFAGAPNTGNITYSVTQTTGFELVANPYTAAISTSGFLSDNSSVITGGVYFWDDGGSNVAGSRGGDYITTNGMGTAMAVEPSGGDDMVDGNSGTTGAANGFIPSVQGVFVEVMAAGDITFSTSQIATSSTANSDANHYRITDFQKVKLAIEGDGLYNEVLIGLGESATYERDQLFDARKFVTDNPLSFYTLLEEEKFVIQALPIDAQKVQLGFDLKEAGEYSLHVVSMDNFQHLSLKDNLSGKVYDLNSTPSITFSSEVVTYDQRFELLFAPNEVTEVNDKISNLKVYRGRGNNGLTVEYSAIGKKEMAIYDLSGKVAFSQPSVFTNNRAVINPKLEPNRVYILWVDNESFKFFMR